MNQTILNRREMIRGSVALAALAFAKCPLELFGADAPADGGTLIPFLDQQPPGKMLRWEQLKTWITANEDIYFVSHYGVPEVETKDWKVEFGGLVKKPRVFTLDEIKKRKNVTLTATLECGGNGAGAGFMGAIGNVKWTGTPLAPLLRECEPYKRGVEVAFWGADAKAETIRGKEYTQNFARALGLNDVLQREDVLLCWAMNGEPLPKGHGAPLRLVVPGWFGIAWVKWLNRVEVLDRRLMTKYMAREYVTLRGEERGDKTIWRETSVGPMDVKSIVARAVRLSNGDVRLTGAAWTDGTPLKAVEVKIDDGKWVAVTLDKKQTAEHAWTFWSYDWKKPAEGEHTLVSRATDTEGRVQPASEDPEIKLKKTYWEANQQHPRKIRIS